MHKDLEILGISFAVCGIVFSFFGIFFRLTDPIRRKNKSELLLCLSSAAMLWHVFMYLMVMTGHILQFPQLYNKGIPFYYLVAPSAYFATYFCLFPQKKLRLADWPHLLPFALALIDIVPYALANIQAKQKLLQLVVNDMQEGFSHSYGFIDQKWHYVVKFILAFGYLMAQWRLLYLPQERSSQVEKKRKRYMLFFTACYSPHLLLQGSVLLSMWFNMEQSSHIIRDAKQVIWVSVFYLTFSMWMFFSAKTPTWKLSLPRLWIHK